MRKLFSHWKWDADLFRQLLVSLLPFALLGVLSSLYFTLDTILLARTGRVADLGQYTVAAKIVRLGLNVFIGASIVFFVKLFRNDVDKQLQSESLLMTIQLSFPIGAILFSFAGPTIHFVVGENYTPAITLLQIFSLLWIIVPLHDFFNIQVLMVHHRERVLVVMYALACLLSFSLNLIMIPIWFTTGAAWAIVLTETAVLIAAIILSRPYFKINGKVGRELLSCLIAFPVALLMKFMSSQVAEKPLLQLVVGLSGFAIIYLFYQLILLKSEFWLKLLRIVKDKFAVRP